MKWTNERNNFNPTKNKKKEERNSVIKQTHQVSEINKHRHGHSTNMMTKNGLCEISINRAEIFCWNKTVTALIIFYL